MIETNENHETSHHMKGGEYMGDQLSASDVALLSGNEGFGGNSFLWIFALLILAGGGLGGLGLGGRTQAATTDELSAGFNFSGINNKLNEIGAGIAGVNQNLSNAVCQSTYELGSKIDNCCCNTQLGVQQLRYDMAVQNSEIKSLIQNESAANRAMMQQDRIESLQAQVYQLQLAQATCGIPKASPFAYGIYALPQANCNGNCNYNYGY